MSSSVSDINLRVLQRMDPSVVKIINQPYHISMYSWNDDEDQWVTKGSAGMEGSLFIVQRNTFPPFKVIVKNRQSMEDFEQCVTEDIEIQVDDQYVLMTDEDDDLNGLWFYSSEERDAFVKILNKLIDTTAQLAAQSAQSGGSGVSMGPSNGGNNNVAGGAGMANISNASTGTGTDNSALMNLFAMQQKQQAQSQQYSQDSMGSAGSGGGGGGGMVSVADQERMMREKAAAAAAKRQQLNGNQGGNSQGGNQGSQGTQQTMSDKQKLEYKRKQEAALLMADESILTPKQLEYRRILEKRQAQAQAAKARVQAQQQGGNGGSVTARKLQMGNGGNDQQQAQQAQRNTQQQQQQQQQQQSAQSAQTTTTTTTTQDNASTEALIKRVISGTISQLATNEQFINSIYVNLLRSGALRSPSASSTSTTASANGNGNGNGNTTLASAVQDNVLAKLSAN